MLPRVLAAVGGEGQGGRDGGGGEVTEEEEMEEDLLIRITIIHIRFAHVLSLG